MANLIWRDPAATWRDPLYTWRGLTTADTTPTNDTRPRRGVGRIAHSFAGPAGAVTLPRVGNFEALEEAPGGMMSMNGQVPADVVLGNPDIFTDGTWWRAWLMESGEVVGGGTLLDPAIEGNVAMLTALGPGLLPELDFDRFLEQNRNYGDWSQRDADPHNRAVAGNIQTDTDGRLRLYIATGQVVANGDKNGVVFWAPGNPITRIAFDVAKTVPAHGGDLELTIETAQGLTGALTQRVSTTLTALASSVDQAIDADDDDLISITLRATAGWAADYTAVKLTNVRVNGLATADDYPCSSIVADVMTILGVSGAGISQVGANGLPLDQQRGTYNDVLRQVEVISDTRTLIHELGAGPVADFGPWSKRQFYPVHRQEPIRPLPLRRYDHVKLTYPFTTSSVTGTSEAADSLTPLPTARTYRRDLSTPFPDSTIPDVMAQSILSYVSTRRHGGDFSLSEVLDSNGRRCSSYVLRAGDELWTPEGFQRVKSTRKTTHATEGQFDDGMAAVEQLVALAGV